MWDEEDELEDFDIEDEFLDDESFTRYDSDAWISPEIAFRRRKWKEED